MSEVFIVSSDLARAVRTLVTARSVQQHGALAAELAGYQLSRVAHAAGLDLSMSRASHVPTDRAVHEAAHVMLKRSLALLATTSYTVAPELVAAAQRVEAVRVAATRVVRLAELMLLNQREFAGRDGAVAGKLQYPLWSKVVARGGLDMHEVWLVALDEFDAAAVGTEAEDNGYNHPGLYAWYPAEDVTGKDVTLPSKHAVVYARVRTEVQYLAAVEELSKAHLVCGGMTVLGADGTPIADVDVAWRADPAPAPAPAPTPAPAPVPAAQNPSPPDNASPLSLSLAQSAALALLVDTTDTEDDTFKLQSPSKRTRVVTVVPPSPPRVTPQRSTTTEHKTEPPNAPVKRRLTQPHKRPDPSLRQKWW